MNKIIDLIKVSKSSITTKWDFKIDYFGLSILIIRLVWISLMLKVKTIYLVIT